MVSKLLKSEGGMAGVEEGVIHPTADARRPREGAAVGVTFPVRDSLDLCFVLTDWT